MPARWIDTRELPIDELTPFPGNARRGNVDLIRQSVRRNGQYRSLVVRADRGAFVVLAGNHTMRALAAEGHTTARCELIECTDQEARRINLVDNRLSDLATDDKTALAALLALLDGDLEGTGYTAKDAELMKPQKGDTELFRLYGVIIRVPAEEQQLQLLEQLSGEGLNVRALIA
jgi:hypothetical protein